MELQRQEPGAHHASFTGLKLDLKNGGSGDIFDIPMSRSTPKKRLTPRQKPLWKDEYLCTDCLFFQSAPNSPRALKGNCSYHKQWIENAAYTTCSEMSRQSLKQQGIYRILTTTDASRAYVRREEKLRTRLFLLKNKS